MAKFVRVARLVSASSISALRKKCERRHIDKKALAAAKMHLT